MSMSPKTSRRIINIVTIVSFVVLVLLTIYWWRLGIFESQAKMRGYLADKQILGPIIFVIIQIVQVVIPIIPGGISLVGGVLFFGPIWGFVYNYVGIVIGSIINFYLARYYGKPFILHIVSENTYNKYEARTKDQKKFDIFFALCIVLPVAPDDILCMIAGLTKMKFSRFLWIILLLKPWTILAYSMGMLYGGKWLFKLIGK